MFDPIKVPLLNTIILLNSGVILTWSHHALMGGNLRESCYSMALTIILGAYFTLIQGLEYYEATFSISDGGYGRAFFLATGFHGFHVIVGTIFLLVSFIRLLTYNFSSDHHFGFEAASWYWHFVDVVWLFLYISIY